MLRNIEEIYTKIGSSWRTFYLIRSKRRGIGKKGFGGEWKKKEEKKRKDPQGVRRKELKKGKKEGASDCRMK